jgi:hypothetical protein
MSGEHIHMMGRKHIQMMAVMPEVMMAVVSEVMVVPEVMMSGKDINMWCNQVSHWYYITK